MSEFCQPQLTTLLEAERIQARIRELGASIARDYAGRSPLLVVVLKGAVPFSADLIRAIDLPVTLDFIAVSSYGASTKSSGEVRLLKDLDASLKGKDVIIVEDIVDTGLTLSYLLDMFRRRDAASVRVAALLDKPERRQREVEVAYAGFTIPNEFVVGFGLDYAERYRNLPYVAILNPAL
ncbi:MAG: hypoxanthine phosphoribosyltransferase [Chloracidobacterium sp. CP2_5A]|nr:MAG: hypoxanthine phosphoribosyltransferase [Chloracidobacterium sp. CP2_5A]